jgi:hypothetical protein
MGKSAYGVCVWDTIKIEYLSERILRMHDREMIKSMFTI